MISVLAILLAAGVAFYIARDPAPEEAATGPGTKTAVADGVGRRASDTPFDLRDRDRLSEDADAPAAPAEAEASPTAEAPPSRDRESMEPSGPPASVEGPPGSPTIEAAITATQAAAQEAVAGVHREMRTKCWDTLDRGGVGADGVELGFSLGFDAEGHVITSAVQQGREGYIQGLDVCLGPIAHAIEVPAPGEPVSVTVSFTLP